MLHKLFLGEGLQLENEIANFIFNALTLFVLNFFGTLFSPKYDRMDPIY